LQSQPMLRMYALLSCTIYYGTANTP
jgi:hypothetical protein